MEALPQRINLMITLHQLTQFERISSEKISFISSLSSLSNILIHFIFALAFEATSWETI